MKNILNDISCCTLCKPFLPHAPRPVLSISKECKFLIIGQAPGRKVHESGIPWDDASGKELRRWLGISEEQFYNPRLFGLLPMGFCYPGRGKSGDLPPRPECANTWHSMLLAKMKRVKLTLLIGQYSQKYYLDKRFYSSLTENVKNYRDFLPDYFPLVHPSPRNKIWQKKNPWFEKEVVSELRKLVNRHIDQ